MSTVVLQPADRGIQLTIGPQECLVDFCELKQTVVLAGRKVAQVCGLQRVHAKYLSQMSELLSKSCIRVPPTLPDT